MDVFQLQPKAVDGIQQDGDMQHEKYDEKRHQQPHTLYTRIYCSTIRGGVLTMYTGQTTTQICNSLPSMPFGHQNYIFV